jgi:CRISPR-associated endonuclease Cas2
MVQNKNNRFKKGELIKKILLTIAGISGMAALLTIAVIAPNAMPMFKLFNIGNKKNIKIAIKKLKQQKLVEIFDKDNETLIKITEKGKERILKYNFEEMKIKHPKKWDGLWRIIIFDIPEKYKRARDALRMKLKELGFLKLQDSVFIFPFACKNEIDFIAEIFNIRKYINYIEAKTVEEETKIKKHFNI